MRFSLDWYRIEMDDAIVQLTALDYVPCVSMPGPTGIQHQ